MESTYSPGPNAAFTEEPTLHDQPPSPQEILSDVSSEGEIISSSRAKLATTDFTPEKVSTATADCLALQEKNIQLRAELSMSETLIATFTSTALDNIERTIRCIMDIA